MDFATVRLVLREPTVILAKISTLDSHELDAGINMTFVMCSLLNRHVIHLLILSFPAAPACVAYRDLSVYSAALALVNVNVSPMLKEETALSVSKEHSIFNNQTLKDANLVFVQCNLQILYFCSWIRSCACYYISWLDYN